MRANGRRVATRLRIRVTRLTMIASTGPASTTTAKPSSANKAKAPRTRPTEDRTAMTRLQRATKECDLSFFVRWRRLFECLFGKCGEDEMGVGVASGALPRPARQSA